jgi:hypothetical protein
MSTIHLSRFFLISGLLTLPCIAASTLAAQEESRAEVPGTVLEALRVEQDLGPEIEAVDDKAAVQLVDPAYAKVANGSTVKVRVTLSGAAMTGSNCTTLELSATGGFSPAFSTQYVGLLRSGESRVLELSLRAPSQSASGTITARTKWSALPSCSGTYQLSTRTATLASAPGWTVTAELRNPSCVLSGDPTIWTMTNSWRYSQTVKSSSPTAPTSFVLPPQPASYTLSASWSCLLAVSPAGAVKWPKSNSRTVSIAGSGTRFIF